MNIVTHHSKNMTSIVRVISLERTPERKATFVANNPLLNHQFVAAVDGALLTEAQLHDPQLFDAGLTSFNLGARGCALSHLAQWEEAIRTEQAVTVAEDDAIFRADFVDESRKVIAQLPPDWDIVVWGWNFDAILMVQPMQSVTPVVMLFNQDSVRRNVDVFKRQTLSSHPLKLDKCFGTPAYTISPVGAEKFKALCFPIKNFNLFFPVLDKELSNNGIDISMSRIYADNTSFVAFPALVVTRNEASIIGPR